jgi:hypothetical protein
LGYSPRFLSSAEVEAGALRNSSNAVLVLPNSWALSHKECDEVESLLGHERKDFQLRLVLTEGDVGAFDEHGRFYTANRSTEFLRVAATNMGCFAWGPTSQLSRTGAASRDYLAERLNPASNSAWLAWLQTALEQRPPAILVKPNQHVRVHRFRAKTGRLVAFERNTEYQMSEDLKQAGGNQALETPVDIEAILPDQAYVYDLRSQTYLGHTDHIRFTLDPWQPSLFALMPGKMPAQSIVTELQPE